MSYDLCHTCGAAEHEGACDPDRATAYQHAQGAYLAERAKQEEAVAWARKHLAEHADCMDVMVEASPESVTAAYWRLHRAVHQLLGLEQAVSPEGLAAELDGQGARVVRDRETYEQILALCEAPPAPTPALVELMRPPEPTPENVASAKALVQRRYARLEAEEFHRIVVDVAEFCMDPRLGRLLSTFFELDNAVGWGAKCVHEAADLDAAISERFERIKVEEALRSYVRKRVDAAENHFLLPICSECERPGKLGTYRHAKESERFACDEHALWGFPEGHELHKVVHEDMRELPEAAEARVLQRVLDKARLVSEEGVPF